MALDILGQTINVGDRVAIATGTKNGRANMRIGLVKTMASGDDAVLQVSYQLPWYRFVWDEPAQEWTRVPYFRISTVRKFSGQVVRLEPED